MTQTTSRKPLSPRRRRLRLTIAILGVIGLAAVVGGWWVHQAHRPKPYRPGELDPEITQSLTRGVPADAPQPRFTDVTREAGLGAFRTFAGDRTSQLPEDMGPGAAWGDFDNDGDDDLFLVAAGGALGLPPSAWAACALYENTGDGRFRKVASFPETRMLGMAAAWGDYDGDGWLDLVVTGYNALRLFHNEGAGGRFRRDDRLSEPKGYWSGVAWGDYDRDGDLDLYVCQYVQYHPDAQDRAKRSDQLGTFVPFTLNPASFTPAPNRLYQNQDNRGFKEVAQSLGVANPTGRSLGALWHDFDNDGWLDLYVANDISDNVLYRNRGGRFEDISHSAWVADYRSAMGLTAGDFDRDGDDDLFITHWVAQENAFYENLSVNRRSESPAPPPAAAAAETDGQGARQTPPTRAPLRFGDIADVRGLGQVALSYVGWGAEFADFDGDGWLDIIVGNGSTLEREDDPKRLKPEEPFLFWNRRGEHFYNLSPLDPLLTQRHVTRGLAVSDYDNDGDVDVLLVHLGQGVQLLRNEMQTGHWLKIRLRSRTLGGRPVGFGDGTTVVAHAGNLALRRTVGSASYLSQSSRVLHFGLGNATRVDRVEVRWLGGKTNLFGPLEADSTWEIVEGKPRPRKVLVTQIPSSEGPRDARARLIEFWKKQRAAMKALRVTGDLPRASQWFHEALALNPDHEDALYYLAQCLAAQGDVPGALKYLAHLKQIDPQSHRGFLQWGRLQERTASSRKELDAARASLGHAYAINPEETGVLLLLGEVAVLRGDDEKAEGLLSSACRGNPSAAGGFFLRAFLAWKAGDTERARALLRQGRGASGPAGKPKGVTAEGDVRRPLHEEKSALSPFWRKWDGKIIPLELFKEVEDRVSRFETASTP